MIAYTKFVLDNGLRVIHHEDTSTPMAVINILYNVGARDEDPEKTGFAHLFEHLMFGGSVNIPEYDTPLQKAGGENNAFTNNDITNYYLTLPANNIETGFWLESDRMLSLAFSEESLNVQRQVVIEEFKQRYLNQPYGDAWLKLRPLAYEVHPYRWATIGRDISHIAEARMEDVRSFFGKFYHPANAILVVAGNVSLETVHELSEKWFGPIPAGKPNTNEYKPEPHQTSKRVLTVTGDVPSHAIYRAYHCSSAIDPEYMATDLLSDILSRGNSSRLYQSLVMEKQLFSEINAYVSGDLNKGLFVIEGRLSDGVALADAEKGLDEELYHIQHELVSDVELQKVKNKFETAYLYGEMNVLNKAMNLAFCENMKDIDRINTLPVLYNKVTAEDIRMIAQNLFSENNCSSLYYLSNNPSI